MGARRHGRTPLSLAGRGGGGEGLAVGERVGRRQGQHWEAGPKTTTAVGIYPDGASPCGALDMVGNVWEWCHDLYQPNYYKESPAVDPKGPPKGNARVLRGGCWDSDAKHCTSSYRNKADPGYADACFGYDIYGFRAVRRAGGG